MKSILFTLLFAAITAVCHASDSPPNPPQKQTPTDAFSALLLEKARLYTDKAEAVAGKAVDAVVREAPIVVEEFLRWRLWFHGFKFAMPAFIFLLSLGVCLRLIPKITDDSNVSVMAIAFASGVVSVFSFFFTLDSFKDFLSFVQILVAPRIYLLEQAANLFK